MSETIKPGDLVRIVRACDCDPRRGDGIIFTVERIEPALNWHCFHCGARFTDGRPLAFGRISKGAGYHPLAWLKRIPPPAELGIVERDEEITA